MNMIKELIQKLYLHACRLCFGIQKKVVFTSFGGKSYSDNPKAISETLHAIDEEIQLVWLFVPTYQNEDLPKYITKARIDSAKEVYKHMATAAVVVNNCGASLIPKHKKQLFIQTWHGDRGFKKDAYDAPCFKPKKKMGEEIPGYCDYMLAGSEFGKRHFRSAFRYPGTVLMYGCPRNDRLLNPDQMWCESLKKKLGIPEETKILLYAPTLRKDAAADKSAWQIKELDLVRTLNVLEEKEGESWLCLLRAHPTIVGLSGCGDDNRIVDMSAYEDMADQLLISDMLITDYSSCAGDFALLRRPVILFQSDKQEYLEQERPLYFNMDDSPFFVAENQDELEQILTRLTPEKAAENCDAILEFYEVTESGHAAESVAKIIQTWINEKT